MTDPSRYDEFSNLVQQASGQVVTYLHAVLLDWNDAEDVFQESCLVLWEKFDEFVPGTNFVGWAIRIAQNKAMHFQRSRKRLAKFLNCELQVSLAAVAAGRDAAATNASLAALTICMDRLSQGDQDLVRRCYGDRLTVRQVASQLGRSPESVHHSLRRVRTLLLQCIREVREDDP
jgi:RNA polymerase sigma-70 factor (ECF subfamily)